MANRPNSNSCPSLLRRASGFLIDIGLIYVFLLTPFWSLLRKAAPGEGISASMTYLASHPGSILSINMISVFITIVVMAYFVILESTIGSTIGMLLTHTHIESAYGHLHAWQLLARNLFAVPLFPFFLLWIIEPVMLLWTKGDHRLMETLSKTRIVCDSPPSSKHI